MSTSPFGASCGSSITIPPSVVRVTSGKAGTPGARLSDTASGKAPKRVRTKEELESMKRHPTAHITVMRKPQPKCTCGKCKADDAVVGDIELLVMALEAEIEARKKANHEQVLQNISEEQNRTAKGKAERDAHLRLIGDSDA